jgi:hypothetical protein
VDVVLTCSGSILGLSGTGIELVGDLGYLLLMCAGVGAIAYIFRQPLVLGFLIAWILIGPFGQGGFDVTISATLKHCQDAKGRVWYRPQ